MNDLEIRRITEDDWSAVLEVARVTFGEEYTDEDTAAFKLEFQFDRSLGGFDDGRLVGTTTVFPMQLTVPGGASLPMGGLSWVGVLPTHRRRDVFRTLLRDQFADMRERGEILSGLGASEGTIYGRYGYGPATSAMEFSVERPYSQFVPDASSESHDPGRVVLLRPDEAAVEIPPLYERLRVMLPGTTYRPDWLWQAQLADSPHMRYGASRLYHVRHENAAGEVDGYAAYRLRENWDKETASLEVKVVELYAGDRQAYRELWRYLLDTDLSRTISCFRGRVDEPLRWLLADPRRFNVNSLYDNLWLRLLDLPRALAARAYASPGALTLEVSDPFPSPAVHTLRLEVDHAARPAAACVPTPAPPDLALGVDVLGMVYLGGTTFANLAAAGRVRELTPGAIDRADLMFSTSVAPYCGTDF